jgi:hypothetical protein
MLEVVRTLKSIKASRYYKLLDCKKGVSCVLVSEIVLLLQQIEVVKRVLKVRR